jgi:hypothetical protein
VRYSSNGRFIDSVTPDFEIFVNFVAPRHQDASNNLPTAGRRRVQPQAI